MVDDVSQAYGANTEVNKTAHLGSYNDHRKNEFHINVWQNNNMSSR